MDVDEWLENGGFGFFRFWIVTMTIIIIMIGYRRVKIAAANSNGEIGVESIDSIRSALSRLTCALFGG